MTTVIPSRGGREMLDSVFLWRYARRYEGRARWIVPMYAVWGAVAGYALALTVIALMSMMASATAMIPPMFMTHPLIVPTLPYLGYVDIILPVVGGVLWGMRGMVRVDEIRFQSQMALHVLRLQELMMERQS